MVLLGIMGKKGSGKDTVSDYLVSHYGYKKMAFADPIKQMAQIIFDLDISQIPYEDRDHALYIAFGPYKNPRYAMSIFIEHGGSGGSTAAPMAKKLFKVVIDRHEEREKFKQKNINFVA